mmetsp:Transcript_33369/g.83826  ORF Transcript_33369/g.83826 Transcript_33369/m.83826 type:complete len:399 (+) Transcript_33369:168-1364(+)
MARRRRRRQGRRVWSSAAGAAGGGRRVRARRGSGGGRARLVRLDKQGGMRGVRVLAVKVVHRRLLGLGLHLQVQAARVRGGYRQQVRRDGVHKVCVRAHARTLALLADVHHHPLPGRPGGHHAGNNVGGRGQRHVRVERAPARIVERVVHHAHAGGGTHRQAVLHRKHALIIFQHQPALHSRGQARKLPHPPLARLRHAAVRPTAVHDQQAVLGRHAQRVQHTRLVRQVCHRAGKHGGVHSAHLVVLPGVHEQAVPVRARKVARGLQEGQQRVKRVALHGLVCEARQQVGRHAEQADGGLRRLVPLQQGKQVTAVLAGKLKRAHGGVGAPHQRAAAEHGRLARAQGVVDAAQSQADGREGALHACAVCLLHAATPHALWHAGGRALCGRARGSQSSRM